MIIPHAKKKYAEQQSTQHIMWSEISSYRLCTKLLFFLPCRPDFTSSNPFIPSVPTARPRFCSRSYIMDNFGIRIESPGFPKEYLINEDCSYFIRLTHSDICFLQVDFTKFSVGNLLGFCSGDYVLINGEGICGNLTGKMNHVYYYDYYE